MAYCAIQGYASGNVDKLWRATDSSGNVCGDASGPAAAYPYSYFYNPLTSTNNRFCVASCPTYSSGTFTPPSCYGGCPSTIGFGGWTPINEDGTYTLGGTLSTFTFLLYGSNPLIGRICIPTSAVFSNVFSSAVDTFSSATSSGTFSNFISDLKNVNNKFIIELAMAFGSIWLCNHSFIHFHVRFEMPGRMYRLGFYFWYYWLCSWYGSYLSF
jgi:hypothetical protein